MNVRNNLLDMVEVEMALRCVEENTQCLEVTKMNLDQVTGYSIAENILSPINMPPFDQSAMDGYAVVLNQSNKYELVGEVKAGDNIESQLAEGQAIRIFTGAMLPNGANAVIRQEDIVKDGNRIETQKKVEEGENIRFSGEQIKPGDLVLPKHAFINPGAIGFLSMLGFTEVSVFQRPKISIVITGSELVSSGKELKLGEIYESNSSMLNSALNQLGLQAKVYTVEDDYEMTVATIDSAIKESDLTIITGGISVGDYDFVGKALNELEVKTHFYKVKQKPGKPLFFGSTSSKCVFALPGNPAAVLSCFYLYVKPCIHRLMGRSDFMPQSYRARLLSPYEKRSGMTHFLKGYATNGTVKILKSQSSAMLSSFSQANCLIRMDSNRSIWSTNDEVDVIMI